MSRADKFPVPQGTHEAAGLKWVYNYSCYKVTLGGWMELGVSYDSLSPRGSAQAGTYKVTVAGRVLKNRCKSLEEGCIQAVRVAQTWLARASAELDSKSHELSLAEERLRNFND